MGRVNILGEPNVLKLGMVELNRLQTILLASTNHVVANFIREFGINLRVVNAQSTDPANKYSTAFKPAYTAPLTVTVESGDSILKAANAQVFGVSSPSQNSLLLPALDGVYKILIRYKETTQEKGTISIVNGQKNYTGAGTEFTKVLDQKRSLIIAGVAYAVDTVTDDAAGTLLNNFPDPTVNNVPFSVGGYFRTPPSVPDQYIYYYDGFEIVATTGVKGTFDYWLAEVTVSGGVITLLVDKRDENVLRLWGTETDTIRLSYSKSYVSLNHTVDASPTEEIFETNVDKLATNDLGTVFPLFDITKDPNPELRITATFQDRAVYISKRPLILPSGNIQFGIKMSSTGIDEGGPQEYRFSFEIVPFAAGGVVGSALPSEGIVSTWLKFDVTVDPSAVDEASAETFETNVGKLATDQNGLPFPAFTDVPLVMVNASPKQDFDIRIVRGSETIVGSNVQFRAYIGSVGVAPAGGVYKATMMFIKF